MSLNQFAPVMNTGENMTRIARVKGITPAKFTVMGWEVEDMETVVAGLKERGVV